MNHGNLSAAEHLATAAHLLEQADQAAYIPGEHAGRATAHLLFAIYDEARAQTALLTEIRDALRPKPTRPPNTWGSGDTIPPNVLEVRTTGGTGKLWAREGNRWRCYNADRVPAQLATEGEMLTIWGPVIAVRVLRTDLDTPAARS